MEVWLGWTIFGVVMLLIIAFSWGFVKYYQWKDEPSGVTGFIGFFSLFCTLCSLFLIPIDIYMVTKYKINSSSLNSYQTEAQYLYYIFYGLFMLWVFIGIPFGYFYYEELGDIQDKNNTFRRKACESLKYTAATAFLWLALIVVGLFINLSPSTNDKQDWTHVISDRFNSNNADRIMPFCMAVLTCIGMFFSMIYTSWGLAAFPISLMKRMRALAEKTGESIQLELKEVQHDLDMLYTKYRGKDNWPPRDKARKTLLERKKKTLENQHQEASSNKSGKLVHETCMEKLGRHFWNCSSPVRYLIGILLFFFSFLFAIAITMHLIDQIINSDCGYQCGWALSSPSLSQYSPISFILTKTSKYFPIDYIFFSFVVFWLFWCTIFGLMMIDIRFLCFKLFSLKPRRTMHNALLLAIGFLILIVCSFNYMIYQLASEYMTFGGRQGSDCKVEKCAVTEIYSLISGILIGMPIFGLVYFIFSWIFVAVFIMSFVYNIYRKPKPKQRLLRNESDDDLEDIFKD